LNERWVDRYKQGTARFQYALLPPRIEDYPAGSTPYLGATGMEMQFLDGASGAILAKCRDTEIGRKYAADLDARAARATQRVAALRGVTPAP
jgi:hypothetical protein